MQSIDLFRRDETALLVIDMQNAFCHPSGGFAQVGRDVSAQHAIIPTVAQLVQLARGAGISVVWTIQEGLGPDDRARLSNELPRRLGRGAVEPETWCIRGTWDAELVEPLDRELRPEDHVVRKLRMSGFYSTTLDATLRIRGIRTLIVTGVNTEKCVESTVRDASFRDYEVVVVSDAVATSDRAFHDDSLRKIDAYFGVVLPSQEVSAAMSTTSRGRGLVMVSGGPHRIRVGVVQAAPVFLDREATTARACELMEEAGSAGVSILGFPEGFIPTHPDWYHYVPASSAASFDFARRLFLNAVEIPSPTTDRLCAAAAASGVSVVIGICELTPEPDLTLYNSQLFIASDGTILGRHRKIMPTLGERVVHARGGGDGLRVFATPSARVGGLICGENSNPLAIMALAAERPSVHVASWPSPVSKDEGGMSDLIKVASQAIAYQMGAFVLSSQAVVNEAIASELAQSDSDRAFLIGQAGRGSSVIVGPDRTVLAGPPEGPWEGILSAEVDLEASVVARHIHDFAGHYNRPDIFKLEVDRRGGRLVETVDEEPPSSVEANGAPGRSALPSDDPGNGRSVHAGSDRPIREVT